MSTLSKNNKHIILLYELLCSFLSKSRIWTSLCYYCDIWVGTPKCYLELLDKLQKEILWAVGRTLTTCFERSTRFQYLVSLSLLLVQLCFLNLLLVLITLSDLMDIPRVWNMSNSLTSASLQVIYLMIYIYLTISNKQNITEINFFIDNHISKKVRFSENRNKLT